MTQTVTVAQGGLKEVLEKERAALVALYNATGGDNWANKANWCSGQAGKRVVRRDSRRTGAGFNISVRE